MDGMFYNMDCRAGAREHLPDASVDLIVTDPPYGIGGDALDKHYNRDESRVVGGYVDVDAGDYPAFSREWTAEAARVLRPGGRIFVVSGYTRLPDVIGGLDASGLRAVNHIIWKFNFGVWTTRKFVSSHYHILLYEKPPGAPLEPVSDPGADGDVWIIQREYRPGQKKNKNQLPSKLLARMIQLGSRPGDLVCDFFLGSFSTACVAHRLGRRSVGFELNPEAYAFGSAQYLAECQTQPPTLDTGAQRAVSNPQPTASTPALAAAAGEWNVADGSSIDLLLYRGGLAPSAPWMESATRCLASGGNVFVVVPPAAVLDALRRLRAAGLTEINHVVWYTPQPAPSGPGLRCEHQHILFYAKRGRRVFNTYERFRQDERFAGGGSMNYADREDVWLRSLSPDAECHTWSHVVQKVVDYCTAAGSTVAYAGDPRFAADARDAALGKQGRAFRTVGCG